jgi:hypothetical protein
VRCCRRDWCTSQNRWHHEAGKLSGYIEATAFTLFNGIFIYILTVYKWKYFMYAIYTRVCGHPFK